MNNFGLTLLIPTSACLLGLLSVSIGLPRLLAPIKFSSLTLRFLIVVTKSLLFWLLAPPFGEVVFFVFLLTLINLGDAGLIFVLSF